MTPESIQIPFTNAVIQRNVVTKVEQTRQGLLIHIEPRRKKRYQRPDCAQPVTIQQHIVDKTNVQGLGLPGLPIRYRVTILRFSYINDAGEKKTFTLDVPGVRIKPGMTEALVEQALYFLIDRNQSLSDTVQSLRDIYGVKTSVSALHRLKMAEADKLPSQGEIMRALDAQKKLPLSTSMSTRPKGRKGGS
jgi:hypothetical protein